ncbi:hypothetical protein KXX54_003079 [Aspergillus fumigatus]|nr:hypothetical protein KXX14_005305 [Aspergillus fumigatus]KAH1857117.1 hypothetical protein KXX54_003079 [Aspergillus fumigatus]KAH2231000.1 hypothetical protein KXV37_002412 [Aspergillus fumigatus]KAH2909593.1 hypothetical protein KXV75_002965 [Aspergillus fumigatus]KAH2937446.1 hypothetical protein KXW15_001707 [Aspergillus fumigatus]
MKQFFFGSDSKSRKPRPVEDKWIVEERSIDKARPLRVVIIGSGISGIIASIRFRQRIPNVDLCVYEKNEDIGGTWLENRYPGCACDIPAHTYQATFEPNKEWSTFYAAAPEIHAYWKRVAEKYGCMKYIKLKQAVVEAVWDDSKSKWQLKVQDIQTDTVYTDECNILISATGALNSWKWPDIPGLHDFKGKLQHSARWDESYDYTGKRAAVIGNGSSGIQIVPGMLPKVAHIDHYIRGRTWLSPTFARQHVDKRGGAELENFSFTPEEIETFKKDHSAYQRFRKEIELELQSVHGVTLLGTPEQIGAREVFLQNMKRRLSRKPEMCEDLIPSFPPVCRRLTPGPGYLEALTDDKVDVITSKIVKVDAEGIITADGQHHPTDVLVCATGFDTTFNPRFPVIGRNGVTLANRWQKTPETYLSLAVDGFPNYFICLGPNAALGEGNLLLLIEKEIDYFTLCVQKMQRDNIRAMSVKKEAVEMFTRYCDQYFSRTVFSEKCRSWYKGGTEDGRVIALWPGSSLHSMKALAHPRWEDYTYDYVNDNPNGWLGDGWTENEKLKKINVDYLNDDEIDFPTNVIACTSMKLRCDGLNPCSSCQKRGIECNNERKKQVSNQGTGSDALAAKREDYEQSSDRGSIKFLLNGGTDSFTQQFLLPPRSDRTRSLEYHNKKSLEDAGSSILGYELKDSRTDYAPTFIESDAATLSFFQDTFIDFFNGPFGDPHKLLDDPYVGQVAYHAVVPPGQDPNLTLTGQQLSYEPERPFATGMIQAILARAWSVPLDAKAQQELSTNLNFLLTTSRIRKFVAMYFKYWQPSCAMLHRTSFDPEIVSLPLLTAVTFMGAMYTNDEREAYIAKRVLDFAELFIFSSEVYASETEISSMFCGNRCLDDESSDWIQFQNFQAGFIIVVVQYWAGSRISRNRVMENRFSEVIKVARRIGLMKCRHMPHDPMDECSWIQKECRIRTMNIISLLDCAFSFYSNYPCRISHTEMEWDFPCQEVIFDSQHPFVEPNFRFSRDIPISAGFNNLFETPISEDGSQAHVPDHIADMTVLDMFILIHLLYAFINTHMTLLAPLVHKTPLPNSRIPQGLSTPSKPPQSAIPEDSTLAGIRTALSRWRDHWLALRNTVSSHEWASMGFYKNGYNFWLVSQLLITKKKSVDVVMQMEVKCEDKLEKLKVLLQDEND